MREIDCPLSEAARRWPEQPALIDDDTVVTYCELDRQVDAVTTALQREGVCESTLVGILADNNLSYPLLLHAVWRLGAVACPVSTRLPETSVAHMLDRIGSELLVTTSDSSSDGFPTTKRQLDMHRLTSCDPSDGRLHNEPIKINLSRPATVIFTSGTTSGPKPVLHSYGNHYYSALGSNENIRVLPGDRWLLSLPL